MLNDALHTLVLDNLSTAVILLNNELQIVYINSTAEELLDVSEQRVLQEFIFNVFHDSAKDFLSKLHHSLDSLSAFTKRKVRIELSGARVLTVDYSVTPVTTRSTQHLLIELVPIDRMLKISKEEAIIASQKTNRALVRGLAHEIKNPLGGIRGAAQLLERELPDNRLDDYTNIIIEEADRLRNLVDRMLGPRKAIEFKPLNIHEVLERCKALISAETSGSIKVNRDYDPSIPELMGDDDQMIQAVLNIMRNAMQALQSQEQLGDKCITIKTRIVRRFTIGNELHPLVCKIDICDNGPGISPEIQDNIFLPMVSGRAEGSGLGLSLSQSIVNQHHGLIEYESKPGNTQFSIYIPLGNGHEP